MSSKNFRRFTGVCVIISMILITAILAYQENAFAAEKTITWATIGGFYTDWAEVLAKEFEQKSGVTVKIIDIDYAQLYEKQVIEMVGGTGAYDIITYDTGWKPEFVSSGWLAPLDEYIAQADPKVIAFDDISPALLELSTGWQGKIYGLPYYNYTMGYFYRYDLFNHPDEQAAFQEKYGYPLAIPQTYEQLADIAQFFRRKPGEKLKGEDLDKDFYGIGLMAGRFPQIQDEIMSIAWTQGSQLINDDGSPGCTSEEFEKAVDFYVNKLLPYAPPGATTSAYDEVVSQMRQGLIAQTAAFYLDQWPNMVKTEQEVPGAEMGAAASPGGHTWIGTFNMGLSKDSKYPQEAFDFMAYLASPAAQRKFAEGGGSTFRMSILSDTEFVKAHRDTIAHYPVLVQILDHAAKSKFYPNFYYVRQTGKIYDEETTWFSAAASGQASIDEAMSSLAEAIQRHCGGNCKVENAHLGSGFHATPAPFTFDSSTWIRKP